MGMDLMMVLEIMCIRVQTMKESFRKNWIEMTTIKRTLIKMKTIMIILNIMVWKITKKSWRGMSTTISTQKQLKMCEFIIYKYI